eukprot:1000120-Ditylum_brightwellii.AAC.1
MKYYMNTVYGISNKTNQHSKNSPVHSSCQGPTDAPPGWGFTSHICLVQYKKRAHGCTICDPTETIMQ